MEILTMRNMLSSGRSIYDMPLKVTYYARVSTEREEQLNSLDSQVMYFENLIKEQTNWTFIPGYVDEGISGASVNKRDSFLRMIRDAKFGKFDLILTKEVSRFARNTLDSIQYTRDLLNYGVCVYFLSDNINTCDPDAELRLTIMSSLAQEEIRKLSDRVRFGYQRSIEKGVVAGSNNILGYKKDNGKLVIDEEQAEIVRKIFELYVYEGVGTTKLSFDLYNKYGYTNAKGKPIHPANIRDIIRNPKYKGYYCANKGVTLDFRTKKRKVLNSDNWVMYEDHENVPPIVSEELWDEANRILKSRGQKHSNPDKSVYVQRFPLTKKLVCFHDNCTYTRGNWKTKEGKRQFWGCTCYRETGKPKSECCNSQLLYEEELAKAFKPIIRDLVKNKQLLFDDISKSLSEAKGKTDYSNDKKKILNQIKDIEKQKDNLFNMRSRDEISAEEFADYRNKYNSKIEGLKNAYDEITKREIVVSNSSNSSEELFDKLNKIIEINDDSVLSLVSTIFEKIIVETVEDSAGAKKTILHCQFDIGDEDRKNLALSQLFPILRSDARLCGTIRQESCLYASIYRY